MKCKKLLKSLEHTQADMDDVKEEIKAMKKNNEHLEAIESKVNDITNIQVMKSRSIY